MLEGNLEYNGEQMMKDNFNDIVKFNIDKNTTNITHRLSLNRSDMKDEEEMKVEQ